MMNDTVLNARFKRQLTNCRFTICVEARRRQDRFRLDDFAKLNGRGRGIGSRRHCKGGKCCDGENRCARSASLGKLAKLDVRKDKVYLGESMKYARVFQRKIAPGTLSWLPMVFPVKWEAFHSHGCAIKRLCGACVTNRRIS
jgi:hypothetical protein